MEYYKVYLCCECFINYLLHFTEKIYLFSILIYLFLAQRFYTLKVSQKTE